MNRALTVPPAVRAVFVKALAGESPHAAALADPPEQASLNVGSGPVLDPSARAPSSARQSG